MSQRTFHDPLHRGITLDTSHPAEAMAMALIDSAPFQRLRRIRQLGPAFLTFHGAESSRFTHSIGVFQLARKAFNKLLSIDSNLEKHRGLLYGSALLHDLGHGPLSHTGEEMFGLRHEIWSARLIREHQQISEELNRFASGTADAVAALLEEGSSPCRVIKTLVSSQLDCDRLDYLLRDSYSAGTSYGQLDLERLLAGLTLAPDGDLAIHPKGLMAVEHYLVVRNLMYRSVYNHRLNEVCNWLLNLIVSTARDLGPGKVWADQWMRNWLWQPEELGLESYLANDDIRTGYHLMRWHEEAPPALAALCQQFLNRQLPKAVALNDLSRTSQLEALALARRMAEQRGLDPNLSCGLRHQQLRSYHPYRGGLRLWDGQQLSALEQASPLVASLITPAANSWLIHPREIHSELTNAIAEMRDRPEGGQAEVSPCPPLNTVSD
ncbi:MAG: HD domain-containing protein [Prochlorococcus sp.]